MQITYTATAQTWKGTYNYNGYLCYSLDPVGNQHWAFAAKGTDAGGHEVLHVKFKIPYHWEGTSTANANMIIIDLDSGKRYSDNSFCGYSDGWIYLSHYLGLDSKVIYTYIVTVYKDNDFGKSRGDSRTYYLHLDKLNAKLIPFSDKAFETHW